jgi:hypothetical protein
LCASVGIINKCFDTVDSWCKPEDNQGVLKGETRIENVYERLEKGSNFT